MIKFNDVTVQLNRVFTKIHRIPASSFPLFTYIIVLRRYVPFGPSYWYGRYIHYALENRFIANVAIGMFINRISAPPLATNLQTRRTHNQTTARW